MRRRVLPGLAVAALGAVLVAGAAADANLLANGTFDSSVSGWTAKKATLALAADGLDGTSAGQVAVSGTSRRYSVSSTTAATTLAGATYVLGAYERSATPGRNLCLTLSEIAGSSTIGSAKSCASSTSAWQQLPQVQYAAARAGDALQVTVQQSQARRGDSFELDDVTLASSSFVAPAEGDPGPTIAGTAEDGQTLTADPGSWTGTAPIAYAYQWQSSADGTTWADVAAGGTGQTYAVAHTDVASHLRVVVTASNGAGSATASSAPTAAVAAAPPAVVSPPAIGGSEIVGATLTASAGTWSGTPPLQFEYQWQSSTDGGTTWSDVGAGVDSYVPSDADLGAILRVVVTATNEVDSATAPSAPTQPVADVAVAPSESVLPAVDGATTDTATLTADPGTWAGSSPLTFGYQWLRCAGDGTGCAPIAGATAPQYTLGPGDEGATFAVIVTAGNLAGSASATSPPSSVAAPICGGEAADTPPATYAHVIWIWMENRSYGTVIGPPGSTAVSKAPFLNGTLVHDCGLATNYHNISHPSLPNYIAATSGSTQGLSNDNVHHYAVTSLFDQVQQAQLEWRSYQESMPSSCDPVDADSYPADHNPALDYTGLAATCPQWDIPLGDATTGAFAVDLANDTLPAFSFVVPNGCNSMESCSVATGDAWLAAWLPLIVSSHAFQSGTTAVFLAWDEGQKGTSGEDCLSNLADTSCQVPLVVLSPYTPAGSQSATLFSHYSLLETTEQLLGLPLLGAAADSTTASLRPDFHL